MFFVNDCSLVDGSGPDLEVVISFVEDEILEVLINLVEYVDFEELILIAVSNLDGVIDVEEITLLTEVKFGEFFVGNFVWVT